MNSTSRTLDNVPASGGGVSGAVIDSIQAVDATQTRDILTNSSNIVAETTRSTTAETALKTNIDAQTVKVTAIDSRLAVEELAMMNMLSFISTNEIESTGATLTLGGSSTTQTINLGTSNAAQLINIGTGSTAKTINLGSSADTVVIAGNTITTTTNNLVITDKQIVLNKNGPAGSGSNSGIQIEEGGAITGYIQQNANRDGFSLQPSNGTFIGLNQSLLRGETPTFAGVTNSGSLTLSQSGDQYGGTRLDLLNRNGTNGMTLTNATTQAGADLCTINLTTNSASRNTVAAIISENRLGALFNNSNTGGGGELQLYTGITYSGTLTPAFPRTVAFGNYGSQINSKLSVSGEINAPKLNGDLNANTATATTVNATVVNATNMTASGVMNTATLNATNVYASGTVTANSFSGPVSGNASSATVFTTPLTGDVTGGNSVATVVQNVGGKTASVVASTVTDVASATPYAGANQLVRRDASSNFYSTIVYGNQMLVAPATATNSITSMTQDLTLNGLQVGTASKIIATSPIISQYEITTPKLNGNLNATTATATTVNATNITTSNINASGVIYTSALQANNISAANVMTVHAPGGMNVDTPIVSTSSIAATTVNVSGNINAQTITNPLRIDLSMTGDVYGGSTLSLLNRSDINGMALTQTGTTQDLCTMTMTTNCATRQKPAAFCSENRSGALFHDYNKNTGGELQLFAKYGGGVGPTAAFGNNGSRINSDLTVSGQLSLYGPSTTSERQATYSTDPNNVARAPPSLCQTMIQIYWNGRAYALPLYALSAVSTSTGGL